MAATANAPESITHQLFNEFMRLRLAGTVADEETQIRRALLLFEEYQQRATSAHDKSRVMMYRNIYVNPSSCRISKLLPNNRDQTRDTLCDDPHHVPLVKRIALLRRGFCVRMLSRAAETLAERYGSSELEHVDAVKNLFGRATEDDATRTLELAQLMFPDYFEFFLTHTTADIATLHGPTSTCPVESSLELAHLIVAWWRLHEVVQLPVSLARCMSWASRLAEVGRASSDLEAADYDLLTAKLLVHRLQKIRQHTIDDDRTHACLQADAGCASEHIAACVRQLLELPHMQSFEDRPKVLDALDKLQKK